MTSADIDNDNFQEIRCFSNNSLGLKAVLVIHSYGQAGIAIGGCRVKKYANYIEATNDAKKLAKNMALKYKVVGQKFGGLKLVVYEIDEKQRDICFRQIGIWLNEYDGRCYLATDSGSTCQDMVNMNLETPYVLDLPKEKGGFGSSIPMLVLGVLKSLQAAIEFVYKKSTFLGLSAYILGLGISGNPIYKALLERKCKVFGFDVDKLKNEQAIKDGIIVKNSFLSNFYDLFIPCLVNFKITEEDINKINVKIIGGSTNNPISHDQEIILQMKGIVVIPDFIISSGAILVDDLIIEKGAASIEEGLYRTKKIYDFTREVLLTNKGSHKLLSETAISLLK